MPQRASLAICASFLVLFVGSAHGALTPPQAKCQKTLAKQGRSFFKKRFNALAGCENAINAGKFPTTTDCALEAGTLGKITKAETKLRDKIAAACSDMVVASLEFGGECLGVTAGTALAECQVQEHAAASDALIATVYGDPVPVQVCLGGGNNGRNCTIQAQCPGGTCGLFLSDRTCAGGANDGAPCSDTADCPTGACVLSADQQACDKRVAKALGKLTNKRLAIVQKCKKKVAADKLPATTDCVAAGQAKIDKEFTKTVDAIRAECPAMVTSTLAFGGPCVLQDDTDAVAACGTCDVRKQADELILVQHGSSAYGATAVAKKITNTSDCVGGRQSRCRVNDYLLKNDRIRVVIQDLQRNLFGIGQFGGQIIDGDIVRTSGPDRDSFEEWSLSLNVESTGHYTSLTVLNDGSNGGTAVIRATGVDDLLDFVNPSAVVAGFGQLLPPSADDNDIPVTVTTDYSLAPGTNYVRVDTTVQNTGMSLLNIFFGEYLNGSGEIEMFQPGYGFGEPLIATTCPVTPSNLCNFTAYMGVGGGDGVSYGYIHQTPRTSTFTTSGVHVPQLGSEVLLALAGLQDPPFFLQPSGNADDSLTFTRFFVVGDGNVSDVSDARNEIQCLPTGTLEGTVTAGGNPAVRADIAVLGNPTDGPSIATLTRNVVTHARTDDLGKYSLTLPPGSYNVVANLEGSPYEANLSTPTQHPVNIAAFATTTVNVALPATGALQVTVDDGDTNALPAKASVVGFDPSPDPFNFQTLGSLISNRTAVFGDRTRNGEPFGLAKTIFIGPNGDSGVVPIEPSNYQVVVSRGPEYSIDAQNVTVTAGATLPVSATVERVIDTTMSDGFVACDFHVHSIDSPDSRIPNIDRVISMLDEGMDFFTPTDHDIRFDYKPVIVALGADDLIGTATGEEITSFDYGHWNAWPLTIDPTQVNGGAVDFGGAVPDSEGAGAGLDYPSAGNFSETPATIMALAHADAPGAENTVQVNHIHSHFGLDGGSGLAIDTALTPPASTVPPLSRRLNPAIMNHFTDTFDALEIWIGDTRGQIFTNFLGQNAGDWFNMINQGIVRTGVADSDTHTTAAGVSGFPRTMVASSSDDPGDLSDLADTLSANVNDGRAFGTDGPMVRVTAFAASTNETAKLELGFPTTISTNDGAVDITVDIQSPTWVEFDTVEYYVNTTTTRFTLQDQETGAGEIDVNRYSITPDFVHSSLTINTVAVPGTSASRFEATDTLQLMGLTEDIWVVVMVKGTDGVSKPLFPVLANSLFHDETTNETLAELTDGNLGQDGITALAFTNPLFIDVDGGGWTAPGVQVNP